MKKRKTLIFSLALVGILVLFLFGGKITGMIVSDTCTDTELSIDGSPVEDIYIDGEVTDLTGKIVKDECIRYQYDTRRNAYSGNWPVDWCKAGEFFLGGMGYTLGCGVKESYCRSGKAIARPRALHCKTGVCYNGQCACEDDSNCILGYKCVLNEEKNANFCTKEQLDVPAVPVVPEAPEVGEEPPVEPLECIVLTDEQCEIVCGEYMDSLIGEVIEGDVTTCRSIDENICREICAAKMPGTLMNIAGLTLGCTRGCEKDNRDECLVEPYKCQGKPYMEKLDCCTACCTGAAELPTEGDIVFSMETIFDEPFSDCTGECCVKTFEGCKTEEEVAACMRFCQRYDMSDDLSSIPSTKCSCNGYIAVCGGTMDCIKCCGHVQ